MPPQDTHPDIQAMRDARYREMASDEKMAVVRDVIASGWALVEAGVRHRHPQADEHEIRMRVASLRIPRELMIAAYGWDPESDGAG